jgi:hypothetical protein
MGFRSTFVTDNIGIEWPTWFVDKWKDWVHFAFWNEKAMGPISSRVEHKTYTKWVELPTDIQKVISEESDSLRKRIRLLFFHECGGCSCFEIKPTDIIITEPVAWREKDDVGHYSCGECHKDYGY